MPRMAAACGTLRTNGNGEVRLPRSLIRPRSGPPDPSEEFGCSSLSRFVPPEDVIAEIFQDESVERIHTRNVVFGCYMLQIRRAP